MVFVYDAVMGRLPGVCVKDGVPTGDQMLVHQTVGYQGLGVAWLDRVHPDFASAAQAQVDAHR
jgi:hypothetical protein